MVRLSRDLKMINIDSRLPALKRYFDQDKETIAVYLYGSYGTTRQTVLSDVDLAVLLRRNADRRLPALLRLQSDVIDITGQEDVNVVILNDLPLPLQYEILATGHILYTRPATDPTDDEHRDFIEYVIKRYPDYRVFYETVCREYDAALREAYNIGKPE